MAEAVAIDRSQEILDAAKQVETEFLHWRDNTPEDTLPTVALQDAVEAFLIVMDGDIPFRLRDLADKAVRLAEGWESYAEGEDGHRRDNHMPTRSLMRSFIAVIEASRGVAAYHPRRPEPVALLLEQKVSHEQIARWIYGNGTSGPFLGPGGQVLSDKILQEAANPGSVVPADWIHPSERAAQEQSAKEQRRAIAKTIEAKKPAPTEDPVALLREGANVSQVALVCQITHEEVYRIASENGIVPRDVNLHTEYSDVDTPPSPERAKSAELPRVPDRAPENPAPVDELGEEELEKLILEEIEDKPDAPAPELARSIRESGGPVVHPNKINAVRRKLKG